MALYFKKDRNGRKVWYIDYYFVDPRSGARRRRRERVGYSKAEAQSALESRRTDVRRKKFDGILPERETASMTLAELRDRYLRHSKTKKTRQTAERERGILDDHLLPEFGSLRLDQITPGAVEEFRDKRSEAKRAAATINKEVQLLKYILTKSVEWGLVQVNLIRDVKPLKVPPGRVRYLEQSQVPHLLRACPKWLRPIVVISMNTGMRRSEILRLRRQDVDLSNRLIILERTKNNDRKIVPMNQTVYEIFRNLPPRLDSPYCFAEPDGQPNNGPRVTIAFRRAVKRAGLENFRLHDLRHHFASWLAMSGHGLRTIQELLGHRDPKMSMRYSHLSSEYLKQAVEDLDRLQGSAGE